MNGFQTPETAGLISGPDNLSEMALTTACTSRTEWRTPCYTGMDLMSTSDTDTLWGYDAVLGLSWDLTFSWFQAPLAPLDISLGCCLLAHSLGFSCLPRTLARTCKDHLEMTPTMDLHFTNESMLNTGVGCILPVSDVSRGRRELDVLTWHPYSVHTFIFIFAKSARLCSFVHVFCRLFLA